MMWNSETKNQKVNEKKVNESQSKMIHIMYLSKKKLLRTLNRKHKQQK